MTLTYVVPKWAFDFVQILANRDQQAWFLGVGLHGVSIARSIELLEPDVTSVAVVAPKMQPHSDWQRAVNQRVSGGQA
jgi:hypothetical protein